MVRDLKDDLEICNKATPGPWKQNKINTGDIYVHGKGISNLLKINRYDNQCDANFITEAREGWPEAIKRAIAAEAEVEHWKKTALNAKRESNKLQAEVGRLNTVIREGRLTGLDTMVIKYKDLQAELAKYKRALELACDIITEQLVTVTSEEMMIAAEQAEKEGER